MIAGVCGGLAEYFDVDPVFMRLAFVLLAFLTGIGFLLYPLLWIIMPEQDSVERPPREVVRENLDRMREDAERLGEEIRRTTGGSTTAHAEMSGGTAPTGNETAGEGTATGAETAVQVESETERGVTYAASKRRVEKAIPVVEEFNYGRSRSTGDRQFIAGVIVLLLGLILLIQNLNLFWWATFGRLWPLALVAAGVFILYRQSQERR